jgi:hypothetical protein
MPDPADFSGSVRSAIWHFRHALNTLVIMSSSQIPMSLFRVRLTAVNPRLPSGPAATEEALVDAGSELSWMPSPLLEQAGIEPVRKRSFRPATGEIVHRDVGYAILRA